MTGPVLTVAVAGLAGAAVLLAVSLVVVRRRLRSAVAEVTELAARLDQVEAAAHRDRTATVVPAAGAASYVITGVGTQPVEPVTRDGRLFADTVLREAVVKGAGLGHGVRRALTPEVRHHIRLEMRREVKRARKQRRSDLRDARRAWEAAGRRTAS